jgi:hypothetical protein
MWGDDGRKLVRELRASNCVEALDALALVLAVTLDPDADSSATEREASRAASPSRGDSRPADEASAPVAAAPARVSEPRTDTAERDDQKIAATDQSFRVSPALGLLGGLRFGPAPGVLPGFGAFIGLGVTWGIPDSSLLRLAVTRYRRADFEVEGGAAEFELDAARLGLCPFGFELGPLSAHGCFEAELGELEARGSRTVGAEHHARPWRSVGASASFSARPIAELELSLLGGVEHPLVRDRFQFNPRTFHEVEPLTGRLELGVALRIP